MSERDIEDFLSRVDAGLAEAQHNMLVEKALHNQNVVIADEQGKVQYVPAKDLLAEHIDLSFWWVQNNSTGLGGAVTTISKKVDTINQHIDKVLENAPTKLKVSVNVNDADWQKIQELFAKERQWMTAQMQTHIREVNSMFADERKKSVNATRNMMVATSVTMPNGSFGFSSQLVSLWLQEVLEW